MAKLKDGFYKQTAEAIGSDLYVLLAGGGMKPLSDFATSTLDGVATEDWVSKNYLALSGGRINGNELSLGLSTNYKSSYFRIFNNTSNSADYGTHLRHYHDGNYQGLLIHNHALYYSDNGSEYPIIHSGNIGNYALTSLPSHTHSYLPLAGGLMTDAATIQWGNNKTTWDNVSNGFIGISNASADATLGYYAGLSFRGYYGIQIRAHGGNTDVFQIRKHNSSIWGAWREIIHSGNISDYALTSLPSHSHDYLPLAGGTMNNGAVVKFNGDGSIVQTSASTSNAVTIIKWYKGSTQDSNYTYTAQLGWHNTGDTDGAIYLIPNPQNSAPWGSDVGLYIGKNTLKWNNKIIVHSGNYTSYTVKKDGTGATGTWGINISGTASNADKLDGYDSTNFIRFDNGNSAYLAARFIDSTFSTKAAETYIEFWSTPGWYNSMWGKVIAQTGFYKSGSSNAYVLLGEGGHKALSDFSMAHSHPYLPTTQVAHEQASNDDWIKSHALSTLRGHVYNTNALEWQYLFGVSSSKSYGTILRTTYGNGTPTMQVMGLYNGTWTSWREAAFLDSNVASATYATNAGNADTVDGLHWTSFARWYGDASTDSTTSDVTSTSTADFFAKIHATSGLFSSRFGAMRGSWWYGGNTQLNTGVGTLDMAGTAVLNLGSYADTNDTYKSLLFLDQGGRLWSYTANETAVKQWSRYVKTTDKIANASWADGASTVTVNDSNSNSTYRMVWHSGNTLYGTGGIYCNPYTDAMYASFMELSRTTDHGLKVGTIRGTAVGSRTGQYIHMYERVHIGSPNGWGSVEAPTYGLSTYGGAHLATNTGAVTIGYKVSSRTATWLKLTTPGHTRSNAWCVGVDDTSNNSYLYMKYNESDTSYFYIRHDGVAFAPAFYQSSDETLKDFYDDIKLNLEDLRSIPKKYFSFKDNPDKIEIGTSAQAVQKLYPEIVSTNNTGKLSVAYDKLAVIALKGIDELYDMILELREENRLLKEELKQVKTWQS